MEMTYGFEKIICATAINNFKDMLTINFMHEKEIKAETIGACRYINSEINLCINSILGTAMGEHVRGELMNIRKNSRNAIDTNNVEEFNKVLQDAIKSFNRIITSCEAISFS